MFLEEHACDIVSYANDNTQYTYKADLDIPINKDCTIKLFKWFKKITGKR